MIIKGAIGASPIDALNYYLAELIGKPFNSPEWINIGTLSYVTGVIIALIAYLISKKKTVFISIFLTLLSGTSISLFSSLLGKFDLNLNLGMQIFFAVAGLLILTLGATMTVFSKLIPGTMEVLLISLNAKIKKLWLSKIIIDTSIALLAFIFGLILSKPFEQLNLFTLVIVFGMGPLMHIMHQWLSRIIKLEEKEDLIMNLNEYIDHTKLGPTVSKQDIKQLTDEAIKYNFKSVCVAPTWVKYAKELLEGQKSLVCTVVGFPHGTHTTETKVFETTDAIINGADEIDMVVNIDAIKAKDEQIVYNDINSVVNAANGKTVKVIIETAFLTSEEIKFVSQIALNAGANFVKTSTGYAQEGATVENVKIMKDIVGSSAFVKASGGVRTKEDAIAMIEAGASRIGTSNGVSIMENKEAQNNY